MTVTTIKSNAVDPSLLGTNVVTTKANRVFGKMTVVCFEATQVGAGDIGSLVELVKLPAGDYTIIGDLSKVYNSAFGASRTLTVGLGKYVKPDGTKVDASYTSLHTTADVSTAASFAPASAMTAGNKEVSTKSGVVITAQVAGGTIPDGATLKGYVVLING